MRAQARTHTCMHARTQAHTQARTHALRFQSKALLVEQRRLLDYGRNAKNVARVTLVSRKLVYTCATNVRTGTRVCACVLLVPLNVMVKI